jgi:hypothetical protein
MAMNQPAAYGLYLHDVAPHQIIRTLNQAGFYNENICVMFSPAHPISTILRDTRVVNPEPETIAATANLIGWLSEFGAVVVSNTGVFIRSQAFCHALMGAKDGMALCGNSATLEALGFPEDKAERFEDDLRQAGVLIYVSCPESAETDWAVELLQRMGAREAASLAKELGAKAAA